MRDVKMALLNADVSFKVVKQLISDISEKISGSEILDSLTPSQQVVKAVNDELVSILGNVTSNLTFASKLTCYMLVGLQGAGKTTVAGKLALMLKNQGKKVLLIACDTYRPAAIKQLQVLAEKISVDFFTNEEESPVEIAKKGIEKALTNSYDIAIIDTAGRLNIDDALMTELKDMKSYVKPQEILLVLDAMIGQEAVSITQSFNEQLGIDGIIMTKLDSDTRGGAMLSVRAVTKKPIKFIGVGEKLEDLEQFHPDRIASRILGMGDIMSVVEKVQTSISDKEANDLHRKILKDDFDLNDFHKQLQSIKKLGPMKNLVKMMPGMSGLKASELDAGEKNGVKIEAIITSMTPRERANPDIIDGSRKRRIALGAGVSVNDVSSLLKRFKEARKMMKMFMGNKKSLFDMFKF